MARKVIDLTTPQPNGKMGEPTKSAWEKTNDNFEELYTEVGDANDKIEDIYSEIATNPGDICGFKMTYVSPNSISISSGSASLANGVNLYSENSISKNGLSLSQFNWYHLYVFYSTPTVVDIEVSLVEPIQYFGTAKYKTGDTSKRYIGSVRAGTGGSIVRFTHNAENGVIKYVNSIGDNNVLNLGKATSTTTVNCSGSIPSTSSIGSFIFETGDGDLAFISNPDVSTNVGSLYNLFIRATKQIQADFPVSSARSINYLMNPGTTGLSIWCIGYCFER